MDVCKLAHEERRHREVCVKSVHVRLQLEGERIRGRSERFTVTCFIICTLHIEGSLNEKG